MSALGAKADIVSSIVTAICSRKFWNPKSPEIACALFGPVDVVLTEAFAHGGGQTVADMIRRSAQRIEVEVGIALGGAGLWMTKELADDGQAKTGGCPKACVSVS